MFAKFLVREWRESLGIVLIALTMMLAMVGLNAAGRSEAILYIMGMYLLFFLPLGGLLLGAGGFQAEFRDNAWIYLFSRPIRKEVVWAFKYVSQLSVLAFVVAAFLGLKRLLPGLGRILSDFAIPGNYSLTTRDFPGVSLYLVVPVMAFTIAFSLSPLSDKAFSVFFAALLLGAGLAWIVPRYHLFLLERSFHLTREQLIWPLIAAAFALASVLTLARSDFSQPVRRAGYFAIRLAALLALAFGLGALVFTEGRILFPGGFHVADASQTDDGVYFQTWTRGLLKYDVEAGKIRVLDSQAEDTIGGFSVRGGTLAYLRPAKDRKTSEVRLMGADGTEARALPLPGDFPKSARLESVLLSPDGRRIALLAGPASGPPELWTMGLDGGAAERLRLTAPAFRTWHLATWTADGGRLVCCVEGAPPPRHQERALLAIDLRTGATETLSGATLRPSLWQLSLWTYSGDSPAAGRAAFFDAERSLRVFDPGKAETTLVEAGQACHVRWSRDGRRLAVSDRTGIRVHDLDTGESCRLTESNYCETAFDWLPGDGGFVMVRFDDGEPSLSILDADLGERKVLPIPIRFRGGPLSVWGLEGAALLKDFEGPLWRVDLASGVWGKAD